MADTKQDLMLRFAAQEAAEVEPLSSGERVRLARLILNVGEEAPENGSEADRGLLGWLNRLSQRGRQKRYRKRKTDGFSGIVIVSEGDSWFQYPKFLTDIIDWLQRNKSDYNIYSLGFAGDWIANILEKKEYREAIAGEEPRVFLISGGGNDLVDHERLVRLVHPFDPELEKNPHLYLNDDYRCLLKIFEMQYRELFGELQRDRPEMHILCHGYAYAIPSDRKGPGFIQFFTNIFLKNGRWLKQPLEKRGITNPATQRAIVARMIDDFNAMLIGLAGEFETVHHIDCRPAVGDGDWYNELHPTHEGFKEVTKLYERKIDELFPNP